MKDDNLFSLDQSTYAIKDMRGATLTLEMIERALQKMIDADFQDLRQNEWAWERYLACIYKR